MRRRPSSGLGDIHSGGSGVGLLRCTGDGFGPSPIPWIDEDREGFFNERFLLARVSGRNVLAGGLEGCIRMSLAY